MANPRNLLKGDEKYKFTPEDHSKGGKRSAEVQRERKALKEELLMLLEEDDNQRKISVALIKEALGSGKAGSVTKAFEVIRDTIGERPVEKVMLAEVEQGVIDEVEEMVLGE